MPLHFLPAYKVAVAGLHNILFAVDMLLLLGIHNMLFLQTLESERQTSVVDVLNQLDPSETAHSQGGYYIQIIQPNIVIF